MAWTSSRALASSARSVFEPSVAGLVLTKSWIWPATWASAWPLSMILRKKKSCAWIAVVPS